MSVLLQTPSVVIYYQLMDIHITLIYKFVFSPTPSSLSLLGSFFLEELYIHTTYASMSMYDREVDRM